MALKDYQTYSLAHDIGTISLSPILYCNSVGYQFSISQVF